MCACATLENGYEIIVCPLYTSRFRQSLRLSLPIPSILIDDLQSWRRASPPGQLLYVFLLQVCLLVHWLHTDNRSIAQPIEAFLLALAIFIASGRLVPKIWQHQYPTLSDSFLIASILNTIALFITDYLTYKLGGMEEYDPTAPEPSVSQAIALKKVR
jgi:hypothetical protein